MTDRRLKPVTILGVRYPSMTAAARATGLDLSSISKAVKDGREDWIGRYPLKAAYILWRLSVADVSEFETLKQMAKNRIEYNQKLREQHDRRKTRTDAL